MRERERKKRRKRGGKERDERTEITVGRGKRRRGER